MGIRAFLARMRERFATQEEMAEWMSEQVGEKLPRPNLSLWLSGERYPDRRSRQIIRRAFRVRPRQWADMLLADDMAGDEDAREPSAMGIGGRRV